MRTVAATTVTLCLLAGFLAWRVAQGPISLAFLAPYISEALALPQFGIRAEVNDVVLAWSEEEEGIRLRVSDLRYRGADDRVGLTIPNVDLMLSGRAALHGVIAPRFIHASGVDARLIRDASGHFRFGLPNEDAADTASDQPAAAPPETATGEGNLAQTMFGSIFEVLSRPLNPDDSMGQLETVSILADRLVIEDWKLNQRWIVPSARIAFQRGSGHVFVSASGALDWRGRRVDLNVDADYTRADRSARVDVRFSEIEPSDFADVVPELAPLAYVSAPIRGLLSLDMNESGERLGLAFDLSAGAGHIAAPGVLSTSLDLTEAHFRGHVDAANGILTLADSGISFADKFRVSFNGTLTRTEGERYGLNLKGQFFDLPVDTLSAYWPPEMAKNARDWVTTRISGGHVKTGRFEAALTPAMVAGETRLPPGAIKLDFVFENLAVNYLPPMTRLTEAGGVATLNADAFELTMDGGKVGGVQTGGGTARITGLQDVDQHADIAATAKGRTADILALIDQKPLGFPSRMGIKPASVGGDGEVKFRIRFPLVNALKVEDIAVNAEATMTGLSMSGLMNRYDLANGQMTMKVDAKGLESAGQAVLNGVPLEIAWKQDFSSRAALQARYSLKGRIDEAGRKALGYPLAPYIDGPADAVMDIEERRGGEVAIGGEFNLTDATITLADAHIVKAAGEESRGKVQIRTTANQPVQFDLIEISGPTLSARAKAEMLAGGGWSADIQSLKYGENDASGHVAFTAGGDSQIELTGKRYDLRKFIEEAMNDDSPPGTVKPRMTLAIRFDEARIDNDLEMRNLSVNVQRAPTRLERVSVIGGFATTGGLTLTITPALEGRNLILESDNAGAVMHFLGVTDLQGGTMSVNGSYDDTKPNQPLAGRMLLKNIRAVNTPFLARLLGIGSFTGLAALLSGEGILFDAGEIPFEQHDGVLTLKPSRLSGSQLGITFEGTVSHKANSVSVNGTAVPAFVLNTLLGKIPLLGNLLVGDGIIGVNFAVSGAKSDPQFTINPLSVIAPGFLRRIFQAPEVRAPTEADKTAPLPAPETKPQPQP